MQSYPIININFLFLSGIIENKIEMPVLHLMEKEFEFHSSRLFQTLFKGVKQPKSIPIGAFTETLFFSMKLDLLVSMNHLFQLKISQKTMFLKIHSCCNVEIFAHLRTEYPLIVSNSELNCSSETNY